MNSLPGVNDLPRLPDMHMVGTYVGPMTQFPMPVAQGSPVMDMIMKGEVCGDRLVSVDVYRICLPVVDSCDIYQTPILRT